ncbi:YbjN domain-containing protein [Reichenbachiella sp.]|uniref:YbjN domain-containing protein n=1 Tax=Reichenbachiella sp. TaxID=2184521 RepID=UPI003BAF510B
MSAHFQIVKTYLLELNYTIIREDESDSVLVVENESKGIKNAVLIVADPLLIIEQFLFDIKTETLEIHKDLLMKNRDIIHGAFALDETGKKVVFRNTHECENLDLNELEATLNSLSLLLSEYAGQLITFSKN